MYKDLSLKEKAKVIREGVRLGLNSIDDIQSLYDEAISYQQESPIVSPYGQWKYPGRDTIIPSNNITMDNVNYPVLGISDTGDTKVMMPWNDYKFKGSMVYEHPLVEHSAQDGKKFNRLQKLSNWYHRNADNIPKFIHRGIYNTIKDSAFTDEPLSEMKYNFIPNLIHNKAGAYDNAFLMSQKQQEEYLKSIGYNKVEDENYGLVNKAVQNYKNATGREVPIFQYGKDDANRSELIPLKNNIYGAFRPQEGFEDKDHLGDIGAAPYRLYRDKDGNLFYKRWDFFDHGDYSRNSYSASDDEYVVPALTTNSQRYGNILDNMGNPYVKTTGYTRISDPVEINHALSTIEGIPMLFDNQYKNYLDSLRLGRYDYQKGGEIQKYQNVPDYNVALYNTISPLGDFPNFWGALAYRRQVKNKLKNGNIYERDYPVGNTQGEKTAMAAWAKRLGIPYDEQDLPVYNGDTVTLPYSLVQEIPYDTNMLKNRIQQNKALQDKYSKYRYSDVVDAAIKTDQYNLDKLRETYKTGKPVGQTEFGWNSRQLVNNGEIIPIENIQSPLNVLGNYNVRYSPEERRLYYSDEYDFNQFENFVPGEPFRIRGYIDLNNKALGGNLFKKGGIYIKPENRGKFTRLKKRTGHSASQFKAHGTPAQRKMATFALNSKHWNHKHDDGGYLYSEGGFLLAPYLYNE